MERKEEGFVYEEKPNITVFGVDIEDAEWFQKELKNFKGNAGKRLFKEMVNRFYISESISGIYRELEQFKERLARLEDKKPKVKTFRGEK